MTGLCRPSFARRSVEAVMCLPGTKGGNDAEKLWRALRGSAPFELRRQCRCRAGGRLDGVAGPTALQPEQLPNPARSMCGGLPERRPEQLPGLHGQLPNPVPKLRPGDMPEAIAVHAASRHARTSQRPDRSTARLMRATTALPHARIPPAAPTRAASRIAFAPDGAGQGAAARMRRCRSAPLRSPKWRPGARNE